MKRLIISSLIAFCVVACAPDAPAPEAAAPELEPDVETTDMPAPLALLTWRDLLAQERPIPTRTIALGEAETDKVDLWLPETPGPHPVVVMVHGGCWQKSIADRTLMNYAAEDLRQRGLAVWNIEYRGVDEPGGGYPGTYLDVARATDALRDHAAEHALDLSRIAGMGHSAGGHLVTWLATRGGLPAESPLAGGDPITFAGVINTGGLADLELSVNVTQFSCLGTILDDLTGAASATRPNVFSDTSPAEMLPVPARFVSVSGAMDTISPPGLATAIADKDRAAGGNGQAVIVPGNNHVDLIAPGTEAWETQASLLQDMLAAR